MSWVPFASPKGWALESFPHASAVMRSSRVWASVRLSISDGCEGESFISLAFGGVALAYRAIRGRTSSLGEVQQGLEL